MSGNGKLVRVMEVVNPLGIHARPAALFVRTASRFESDVSVRKGDVTVSGKSIMGLISLEATVGSRLTVTADGPDAEEALDTLETLMREGFFFDE